MLAYILALLVGLGSFGLYMAAFFFPEVHRKNDFIWSGVGLFYALVLWVCAGRITGGVLLGQIAGVTLLGWLGWQTFLLRRQVAPIDQQTPLPTADDVKATFSRLSSAEGRSQLTQQASRVLGQVKEGVQGAIAAATQPKPQVPGSAEEGYVPPNLEEFGTAGQEAIDRFAKVAIPDQTLDETDVAAAVDQAEAAIAEAATELAEQQTQLQNTVQNGVDSAASAAAKTIAAAPKVGDRPLSNLTQKSTNFIKVLSETVQSLLKGFGKKESKPIYVRKEFRDQPTSGKPKVTDATVISVVEEVGRASDGSLVAEATIEIESTELAPDLLASALSNASAEDILEELLEDISAQEENPAISETETTQAVPPHPPNPDLIEAAIADAEEKGIAYDPPTSESGDS
ncbi:MAG: Ycf66 family protein [Leptolyngbyaceae cyanobacterium bins.302]|nr:Ycf66 family protein [Leptolyngbyaceae cyanobacterium bins.302]